jgi:hypothetical protein
VPKKTIGFKNKNQEFFPRSRQDEKLKRSVWVIREHLIFHPDEEIGKKNNLQKQKLGVFFEVEAEIKYKAERMGNT